jgi:hypothetical protein
MTEHIILITMLVLFWILASYIVINTNRMIDDIEKRK